MEVFSRRCLDREKIGDVREEACEERRCLWGEKKGALLIYREGKRGRATTRTFMGKYDFLGQACIYFITNGKRNNKKMERLCGYSFEMR